MPMFLGHIAFMLELALFVAGLALWHFGRQGAASALRAGGLLAMAGAALSALCTGYYLIRYQVQGDLDHAYPFHPGMERHEMMEGGMMGPGMMRGMMKEGMRERGGEGPPAAGNRPAPPGHEEHHPEQPQ